MPDSSERLTGVILVSGRSTPSFSLAIAGSFQVLILPEKMSAMTGALRLRLSTSLRLKATAIGET